MSREILDCLKRQRDICVKNVIPSQNTAFMFTPALRYRGGYTVFLNLYIFFGINLYMISLSLLYRFMSEGTMIPAPPPPPTRPFRFASFSERVPVQTFHVKWLSSLICIKIESACKRNEYSSNAFTCFAQRLVLTQRQRDWLYGSVSPPVTFSFPIVTVYRKAVPRWKLDTWRLSAKYGTIVGLNGTKEVQQKHLWRISFKRFPTMALYPPRTFLFALFSG